MADVVTTPLWLNCTYDPAFGRCGGFELRVDNQTTAVIVAERLALTTTVPIEPIEGSGVTIARRTSGYFELAVAGGIAIGAQDSALLAIVGCEVPPTHGNDGPASAFFVHADGSTTPLTVGETRRMPCPAARVDDVDEARSPAAVATSRPWRGLRLEDGSDLAHAVWARLAACERAVHERGPLVLAGGTDADVSDPVAVRVDPAIGAGAFVLPGALQAGRLEVVAGDEAGLRRALAVLARERRGETPPRGAAVHGWRGLHIDLARQWFPAATVTGVLQIAGWYGLDRVHLHLTDDEGWRVPVTGYPALTEIGAWRGHGWPVPPLLGSAAELTGGSYTGSEIADWVRTASGLGIELVPEVDLPAHSYAALAALPFLRDPDDVGGARSVQGFADNVLNPGVGATMPFLEAVFGTVADLFPGPWIHVGGDEVPSGAWLGSPAALRWAASRGVAGSRGIERAFMRDVIHLVRVGIGRQVGVWQEAAECGALQPGDGYAIGWVSNQANRQLAAAGHEVVAAPAQAYYLDMAESADWSAPGASWAGVITPQALAAFDPVAGWTAGERARLAGVQACLWTEHVHDDTILRRLLLPRLAVFADRCWSIA